MRFLSAPSDVDSSEDGRDLLLKLSQRVSENHAR